MKSQDLCHVLWCNFGDGNGHGSSFRLHALLSRLYQQHFAIENGSERSWRAYNTTWRLEPIKRLRIKKSSCADWRFMHVFAQPSGHPTDSYSWRHITDVRNGPWFQEREDWRVEPVLKTPRRSQSLDRNEFLLFHEVPDEYLHLGRAHVVIITSDFYMVNRWIHCVMLEHRGLKLNVT